MKSIVQLSTSDRRLTCLQVEDQMGLQAASVEKDFWVCWTLHQITLLPDIGPYITFKGGTSLSKVWKLIERFSEDIDLIVDKEILGFGGEAAPDNAPSRNQTRRRVEGLMEACRLWVQERLQPALAARIQEELGDTDWRLEVDPDAEDGQCLLFHYPGAFAKNEAGYVRPVVKIELGARSDDWPAESMPMQPYLATVFPNLADDASFEVNVLAAKRTFWEKAMLLHEETFRPEDKPRKGHMARHYYDLWCLIKSGVAEEAATDEGLFQRVAAHREVYFRWSWVDYSTLKPGTMRLLPPPHHIEAWRKDFQQMQGVMFFGDVPKFDEILRLVGDFEQRFNSSV